MLKTTKPKRLRIEETETIRGMFDYSHAITTNFVKSEENIRSIQNNRVEVLRLRSEIVKLLEESEKIDDFKMVNDETSQILPAVSEDQLRDEFKMPPDIVNRMGQYKADAKFLFELEESTREYLEYLNDAKTRMNQLSNKYFAIKSGMSYKSPEKPIRKPNRPALFKRNASSNDPPADTPEEGQ